MLTGSTVPDRLASCTSTRAPLPTDGASEIVGEPRESVEVQRADREEYRRLEQGFAREFVDFEVRRHKMGIAPSVIASSQSRTIGRVKNPFWNGGIQF